jgi:AAA ATPase domain
VLKQPTTRIASDGPAASAPTRRRHVLEAVGGVTGWEDVTVLRRATSPVLIGRAGERARLDVAFRAACAGEPVTVLIAGEAGIGKTRLVNEFAGAVAGEATVLFGACIDERVPYSPVADALRSLVRSASARRNSCAGVPASLRSASTHTHRRPIVAMAAATALPPCPRCST